MSNKVLSICIPSYNMEKYLNRCVDSLLVPDILDDIEIIIVNDGSKDATLSIANQYKVQYPNSVVVIDKPNGHYGSTVNAALKVATGKYFRILDADDWFDKKAFIIFVNKLKTIDVDCVFTRYTTHDYNKNIIIEQVVDNVIFNCELTLSEYLIPTTCYAMHSLTYRLGLLRSIDYKQTEGICYTDNEYVFYPLSCARNIYNIDVSLYQYYIGRPEQSMSYRSLSRNYHDFEILFNRFKHDYTDSASDNVKRIQNCYIVELVARMLNIIILYAWNDIEKDALLRRYLQDIKTVSNEAYSQLVNRKIRGIPYIKMWILYPKMYKYILFPVKLYYKVKS